jgi:hypothetical protein
MRVVRWRGSYRSSGALCACQFVQAFEDRLPRYRERETHSQANPDARGSCVNPTGA